MKSEKSRVATDTKRKCSHPGEGQSQTSRRAERRAKNAHVARTFLRPTDKEARIQFLDKEMAPKLGIQTTGLAFDPAEDIESLITAFAHDSDGALIVHQRSFTVCLQYIRFDFSRPMAD